MLILFLHLLARPRSTVEIKFPLVGLVSEFCEDNFDFFFIETGFLVHYSFSLWEGESDIIFYLILFLPLAGHN